MAGKSKLAKPKMSEELKNYFARMGSVGGKVGSKKLTKKQRVDRAKKAVAAREAKKRS